MNTGAAIQEQILGLLVQEPVILKQHRYAFDTSFFEQHVASIMARLVFKFFDRYQEPPDYVTLASMLEEFLDTHPKEADFSEEYQGALNRLYMELATADREYIEGNLEELVKSRLMTSALLQAVDKIAEGSHSEAAEIVSKAASFQLHTKSVGICLGTYDRTNYLDTAKPMPISTGFDCLDEEMHGGLRLGEVGVLCGGTGTGKSMWLINMFNQAMLRNRRAAYISLEMLEDPLCQRSDAGLFDKLYWDLSRDEDVNFEISSLRDEFLRTRPNYAYCTINYYPTSEITVPELMSMLKSRYAADPDCKPEILFIDYADLFKATTTYDSLYENCGVIYNQIVGMAKELMVPIWTATQANREAKRTRLVDLQHISDSYKKAHVVDVVYTISQDETETQNKLMRLYSAKMRNHDHGKVHYFRTEFEKSRVHECNQIDYENAVASDPDYVAMDKRTAGSGYVKKLNTMMGKLKNASGILRTSTPALAGRVVDPDL